MSKQDRQPARNVTGLEYKYGLGDTVKALQGLSETSAYLQEQARITEAELSLRIRYDETGKIVSMLNASADIIRLTSNRLEIESDHFSLTKEGVVTATAGIFGGCEIVDGVLKVPAAHITGKLTVENIDTGTFTDQLDGMEERVRETETSLTVLSGQIAAKVSQTDFDSLGNRVQATESSLSVLPGQIASKVSQTDFDTLGNRVGTAESNITQLPGQILSTVSKTYATQDGLSATNSSITQLSGEIASKVSQTDFDNLGERVGKAESDITQLPGQILSTVSATYATNEGLKSANSKIDQLPNQILSTVSATYATKDSLKSYATTTSIDQLSDRIDLKASQTDFDALGGRVSSAEGQISAMSGEIALKVSQSDFDTLGNTVNSISGELALKIGENDSGKIASMLNASADEINITSDKLKIKSSGFELSGGSFNATSGTIGGWVIEFDDSLNDRIIRCQKGQLKYFSFTSESGTPHYGRGYVFTALTSKGVMYLFTQTEKYEDAEERYYAYAFQMPQFSNSPLDPNGGGGIV